MRTVIAGSRSVMESDVYEVLRHCPWVNEISCVISGTARGADRAGERWAKEHNLEVMRYPAEWELYGRGAGPRRNREMAENADALVAVWNGISRGTESMIRHALRLGLRTLIYRLDTNEYVEKIP